jgi:glycine hydroxymethyltransferase
MIMVTKKGIEKDPELPKKLDRAVFPGLQGGPHENIIAAKAIAFGEALKPEFKEYGERIVGNAKKLASVLMENGIKLVSNGTENHLLLVDLTPFGIGLGRDVAVALEEAGIVCNANSIPKDPSTPFKPSGIRLGTPILTSRGMGLGEMEKVGKWIAMVIKDSENAELKYMVRKEVKELCEKFPLES